MTATTEYYRQEPVIHLRGGMNARVQIVITRVQATSLEDKITDVYRLGALNLTGWTGFVGQLRSFDGLVSYPCTVTLDGPGDEGALIVEVGSRYTWAFQQAGIRAGQLTIGGTAPGGGRFELVPARWNLKPGSTDPLVSA